MEQTDQVIVYYIYASLDGSPEEIEALCAMRVDDIETPEDREEDDDNNSSTPDHDNDYGSVLPCTACRGSGRCSKCGGDGMLYSSASGEELFVLIYLFLFHSLHHHTKPYMCKLQEQKNLLYYILFAHK